MGKWIEWTNREKGSIQYRGECVELFREKTSNLYEPYSSCSQETSMKFNLSPEPCANRRINVKITGMTRSFPVSVFQSIQSLCSAEWWRKYLTWLENEPKNFFHYRQIMTKWKTLRQHWKQCTWGVIGRKSINSLTRLSTRKSVTSIKVLSLDSVEFNDQERNVHRILKQVAQWVNYQLSSRADDSIWSHVNFSVDHPFHDVSVHWL